MRGSCKWCRSDRNALFLVWYETRFSILTLEFNLLSSVRDYHVARDSAASRSNFDLIVRILLALNSDDDRQMAQLAIRCRSFFFAL